MEQLIIFLYWRKLGIWDNNNSENIPKFKIISPYNSSDDDDDDYSNSCIFKFKNYGEQENIDNGAWYFLALLNSLTINPTKGDNTGVESTLWDICNDEKYAEARESNDANGWGYIVIGRVSQLSFAEKCWLTNNALNKDCLTDLLNMEDDKC